MFPIWWRKKQAKVIDHGLGKTMPSIAERWRANTGFAVKRLLIAVVTSVAVSMHSPITLASGATLQFIAEPFEMEVDNPVVKKQWERVIPKDSSAEQRAAFLAIAKLGVQWVAGKVSIQDVEREYGLLSVLQSNDHYLYTFNGRGFGASFTWYEERERQKAFVSRKFEIAPETWVGVAIDRDELKDALGLVRREKGEIVDGIEDRLDYYAPPIPGLNPYVAHLNYRLPLAHCSEYDVTASFDYEVRPDQPRATLDSTENLRSVQVSRWYLTSAQFEQRNHAKRVKYGSMNLRTGMVCPETGFWQAWTDSGSITKPFVWWAGRRFEHEFVKIDGRTEAREARFTWVDRHAQAS